VGNAVVTDYDASNERHIAIQRRVAKALDEAHDNVVHSIMGVADGRAYIYDLLIYCHVFDQPFSPNPHLTAFGCGQLDVGQVIFRKIHKLCPDEYIQMMREANARDATDDARRSRSDKDANRGDIIPIYVHPGYRDDSPTAADSDETRGFGREE